MILLPDTPFVAMVETFTSDLGDLIHEFLGLRYEKSTVHATTKHLAQSIRALVLSRLIHFLFTRGQKYSPFSCGAQSDQ